MTKATDKKRVMKHAVDALVDVSMDEGELRDLVRRACVTSMDAWQLYLTATIIVDEALDNLKDNHGEGM